MNTSYIAINPYRSSTSHGFANTWKIYRLSKELRKKMLTTIRMGIRTATPAEIRDLKKEEFYAGCEIEAYEVEGSEKIWYTR